MKKNCSLDTPSVYSVERQSTPDTVTFQSWIISYVLVLSVYPSATQIKILVRKQWEERQRERSRAETEITKEHLLWLLSYCGYSLNKTPSKHSVSGHTADFMCCWMLKRHVHSDRMTNIKHIWFNGILSGDVSHSRWSRRCCQVFIPLELVQNRCICNLDAALTVS